MNYTISFWDGSQGPRGGPLEITDNSNSEMLQKKFRRVPTEKRVELFFFDFAYNNSVVRARRDLAFGSPRQRARAYEAAKLQARRVTPSGENSNQIGYLFSDMSYLKNRTQVVHRGRRPILCQIRRTTIGIPQAKNERRRTIDRFKKNILPRHFEKASRRRRARMDDMWFSGVRRS